jgi:hypothetical protein
MKILGSLRSWLESRERVSDAVFLKVSDRGIGEDKVDEDVEPEDSCRESNAEVAVFSSLRRAMLVDFPSATR